MVHDHLWAAEAALDPLAAVEDDRVSHGGASVLRPGHGLVIAGLEPAAGDRHGTCRPGAGVHAVVERPPEEAVLERVGPARQVQRVVVIVLEWRIRGREL